MQQTKRHFNGLQAILTIENSMFVAIGIPWM